MIDATALTRCRCTRQFIARHCAVRRNLNLARSASVARCTRRFEQRMRFRRLFRQIPRRCIRTAPCWCVGSGWPSVAVREGAVAPLRQPCRRRNKALVADLEHRTFEWFCDSANPENGLIPDHCPGERAIFSSDRRGRLRPDRLRRRRRARLDHARSRRSTERWPHCDSSTMRRRATAKTTRAASTASSITSSTCIPANAIARIRRGVDDRHHPAARRRAVRAVVLRPRHAAGKADPQVGRCNLSARGLDLDAAAQAADRHGLDAGRQVSSRSTGRATTRE